MRIIEIIINPEGETKLETRGFSGASCKDATKRIERDLGIVSSDTPTPEAFAAPVAQKEQVRS